MTFAQINALVSQCCLTGLIFTDQGIQLGVRVRRHYGFPKFLETLLLQSLKKRGLLRVKPLGRN